MCDMFHLDSKWDLLFAPIFFANIFLLAHIPVLDLISFKLSCCTQIFNSDNAWKLYLGFSFDIVLLVTIWYVHFIALWHANFYDGLNRGSTKRTYLIFFTCGMSPAIKMQSTILTPAPAVYFFEYMRIMQQTKNNFYYSVILFFVVEKYL